MIFSICDFLFISSMDFSIILNFFPYLLFLIATTPNFFASQKNEGRKGKEMKKNDLHMLANYFI
jgi:hypothetical protein